MLRLRPVTDRLLRRWVTDEAVDNIGIRVEVALPETFAEFLYLGTKDLKIKVALEMGSTFGRDRWSIEQRGRRNKAITFVSLSTLENLHGSYFGLGSSLARDIC